LNTNKYIITKFKIN